MRENKEIKTHMKNKGIRVNCEQLLRFLRRA